MERLLLIGLFVIFGVITLLLVGNALWNRRYNNPAEDVPATDADLLTHGIKTIQANGQRFAYRDAGNSESPLVLLLHGFPETADCFEAMLAALAKAGYYAVAPYMRGYYPTDIPASGDYAPLTLGSDVIALIDAFHRKTAIVIGHDWGAVAAYAAANLDPARIEKLVAISIPHPATVSLSLNTLRQAPHFAQLQAGFLSEFLARRDNFAYIDHLYAFWSPHWTPSAAEMTSIKTDFARAGRLRAALGYYTSLFADRLNRQHTAILNKPIAVPTLAFVGEDDNADPSWFDRSSLFTAGYQLYRVHEAGHFLPQEAAPFLMEHILRFIGMPA